MSGCDAESAFSGFRFPPEVIAVAVRWYLRYGLSYRDLEALLAERGVTVDHVSVFRWVQRFTPEFVSAARPRRHVPGDRWFVDETYVKVAGRWTYLYRAVDQHGQIVDVWLSRRRDLPAARQFFTQAIANGCVPVEVTTDRAPGLSAGSRRDRAGRPARHRPVREQRGRGRPRPPSRPDSGRCAA
jgi:transposase, IS6 family